ncbi:MAG: hypothetical protein JO069_01250, partial [Verrucomicrobia bacterium]|nr:hypothetical protein [Verrucomicrobiota bacterium]
MVENQDEKSVSLPARPFRGRRRRFDPFLVICWVASVATVATLVWIVFSILQQAWPAIRQTGVNFFLQS